ncbi:katanin p60 ATPase-containing subunit A1 [Cucumis melo var. makuwa]|uniref:Katanin p60 ATPase-containing subunit A1 n=1 Tax=Cucumis melo var. makuwa TaxID=1194695 RepID=A0A5D3C0A0_CUCMM|nr:katanin p60 ATPase-containing subunit A1 [Cucumis melo var. makuwa]
MPRTQFFIDGKKSLLSQHSPYLSVAQPQLAPPSHVTGVVYWQPPQQALKKAAELVWEPSISRYGADEGIPELREALTRKLNEENKLYKSSVMVTAGANQAFVNLVLTLCDAGDSVVMFAPYYFNAYMSFQMTGVTNILVGPGDPKTLHPDPG